MIGTKSGTEATGVQIYLYAVGKRRMEIEAEAEATVDPIRVTMQA